MPRSSSLDMSSPGSNCFSSSQHLIPLDWRASCNRTANGLSKPLELMKQEKNWMPCPTSDGMYVIHSSGKPTPRRKISGIRPFERIIESTPSVDGATCSTESSPLQDERLRLPKSVVPTV